MGVGVGVETVAVSTGGAGAGFEAGAGGVGMEERSGAEGGADASRRTVAAAVAASLHPHHDGDTPPADFPHHSSRCYPETLLLTQTP